MESAQKKSLWK